MRVRVRGVFSMLTNILPWLMMLAMLSHFAIGILVVASKKRHAGQTAFVIASFVFGLWSLSNFLIYKSDFATSVRFAYFGGALLYPQLFVWALYYFAKTKVPLWQPLLVYVITAPFAIAPIATDFLVHSIVKDPVIAFAAEFGPMFPWYMGFFAFSYASIIALLIFNFFRSSPERRQQIIIILGGFIFFGVMFMLVNILLPIGGFENLIDFDVPSSIILVGAIAFAILRYKLFNLRVVGANVLVVVLWIILFAQLFNDVQLSQFILHTATFVLVVIMGIFLMRAVSHEVRQRNKISILADNLEKANMRLKELDKLKSEFLSLATHQMRSPLTVIKGYASLLANGSYGKVPAKMHDPLQHIVISSLSMNKLIDSFLNISRIEQGKMLYNFSVQDIEPLFLEVIEEERLIAESEGLKLTVSFDKSDRFIVNADLNQLRQVFVNLIDNAIKYTQKGEITVSLVRSGESVRFAVADTGIGMHPEESANLFQKFTRLKNAGSISAAGSGLGLYLAKTVVSEHKGRIWAESEGEGKGSTFIVELPSKE